MSAGLARYRNSDGLFVFLQWPARLVNSLIVVQKRGFITTDVMCTIISEIAIATVQIQMRKDCDEVKPAQLNYSTPIFAGIGYHLRSESFKRC